MIIKVLDPVMLQIKPATAAVLGFETETFIRTKYGRQRQSKQKSLIDKKGQCLTGLLNRLTKKYPDAIIQTNYPPPIIPTTQPKLKNITLREDQARMVQAALIHKRGILQAPTRSGKTVIAAGVVSCLPYNTQVLFLVHTKDLCMQAWDDLSKYLSGDRTVGIYNADIKQLDKDVTVGMIQSMVNIKAKDFVDLFDVIICDEVHHAGKCGGIYHKLMMRSLAPMRIGLTATPHTENDEQGLMCEGLFGPVIETVTLEQGFDAGFLTRAKATLIKIPTNSKHRDLKKYGEIKDKIIVNNAARNRTIVKTCLKDVAQGRSCLIYVNELDHGDNLLDMFENFDYHDAVFIEGSTGSEERVLQKKLLHEKTSLKVVIATTVWKEGVTIPSLDCIYIAAGGKKELALLQTVGRGIGRAAGKNILLIRDFIDTAKYLSEHAVERIGIYLENGWL